MELSLVIPTYNRCADLLNCIESILKQDLAMDRYEIIIVDNGPSTDETAIAIVPYVHRFSHIRFVQTEQKGCVAARILGFMQAQGGIVLTLDDDVEFLDTNTLVRILQLFDDPEIGMAGALEWRSSTHIVTVSSHTIPRVQVGTISMNGIVRTQFEQLIGTQTVVDVDHFRSCCMAIRKKVYDQVGGFVSVYSADGMGFRYETDLCLTVKEHGYRVVLAPFLRIWHKASDGTSTFDTGKLQRRLYLKKRNHTFFMLRHFWRRWQWVWLVYEILVGTERVPGVVYLLHSKKNISVKNIQAVILGVVAGYQLYINQKI